MDDELGLDYISKHFDKYTIPEETTSGSWRMLIVDGHSSHVAWPVIEYALDHHILVYCLPSHSTHLMQPLDVACFGPLAKAYRTSLQDFIYMHPGQPFGKQEFWDCLCIACEKALTEANILSGFKASGIHPFCPEEVLNHAVIKEEAGLIKQEPGVIKQEAEAGPTSSTPLKVANIRSTVSKLSMTPHSRAIVQESLIYLESKVVQYRVIEPNSQGVKVLRSNKQPKPRSQKQIKGPRTLDRAYIEQEKARIAAMEVLEAEKAANRKARKLAKELKAKEAKMQPKAIKIKGGGTKSTKSV